MIPCPHCDREFEKRSGLMRHVTSTHPDKPTSHLPVNPGGAIEPVVPVPEITPEDEAFVEAYRSVKTVADAEPETYAESLDELEPGQEPYVDPPVDDPQGEIIMSDAFFEVLVHTPVRLTMDDTPYVGIDGEARIGGEPTVNPANGIQSPNPEQYKRIRSLIRSGRSRSEAWMTVVGFEPAPEAPQPADERPIRLQQVRNRIYTSRTGEVDQIDARWLLQLAEIGADAVKQLGYHQTEMYLDSTQDIIERWKAAIQ